MAVSTRSKVRLWSKIAIWVGLPGLVFLLSVIRTRLDAISDPVQSISSPDSSSRIAFPLVIDAGPVGRGDKKEVRFSIANTGKAHLQVSDFRRTPACACSPVERIAERGRTRAEKLDLDPGEHADLVQEIVAVSPVGTMATHYLEFETTDLTTPRGRIEIRLGPVTGIQIEPATLLLGDVMVGSTARHQISIHRLGTSNRTIARVTSSDEDRIRLQWRPASGDDRTEQDETIRALVGRIDVEVISPSPSPINGLATIHYIEPGRSPQSVPIIGRIVLPVTASPEVLVLPRQSDSGPIYSARCVFRSVQGLPLNLKAESTVPGISTVIAAQDPSSPVQIVTVIYDPKHSASDRENMEFSLEFSARVDQVDHAVNLPVRIRKGGDP